MAAEHRVRHLVDDPAVDLELGQLRREEEAGYESATPILY